MLVFEDPESETVWLGKGTPRSWLENGKTIAVTGAPARFGQLGFKLASSLNTDRITGEVTLPSAFHASVKLRCRMPGARNISSVELNGRTWEQFSAEEETITLPQSSGHHILTVHYRAQ